MANKRHNQGRLEEEMVEMGRERYLRKVRRAKETSIESTTSVGQYLLSESMEKLAEALKSWIAAAKSAPGRRHRALENLQLLPVKVTAGLTARAVLDCISSERKITSTATIIGRMIEDEVKFRTLKEEEPALWNQIHRTLDRFKSQKTKSKFINKTAKYHKIVLPQWDRRVAASVGLTLIELLRQSTGIIDVITRKDPNGKSFTILRPTDELLKWMKETHEYNSCLSPVWLPMVETPVDWMNPYIGGYQSANIRRRPLVKTLDPNYLEELALVDMPNVYKAINILQRTEYVVHGPSTDLLRSCWDRGHSVDGVPSMENIPIPEKPADISTNKEARRSWRRVAARTHFENERLKSKRLQVMKVLHLCDKFSEDTLRYVINLDFRARAYPVPYFLQPQGPSWVKALLRFRNGKVLSDSGVERLYINAANHWGLDKEPNAARLEWAESNMGMIRAVGADPSGCMEWVQADDPWLFAAACEEINNMHEEGSGFRSTLPISMDATTQGLQIYAMLLRDPVSAAATNVTPGDRPQDVYQTVADIARRKLYEDNSEYASKWLDFGITRKTTKRQTMTLCYGSTFFSCRSYTNEWFYEQLAAGRENPFGEETYKPCAFLATIIWESIGEVVASARIGMDWLRKCAQLFLENDVTPRWTTPLGFPVKMWYENTQRATVKTLVSGVLRQHRLRMPNGQVNRRKTVNALPANLVHSLDGIGGILGATINRASEYGVNSIMTVHDNISVLAEDWDIVGRSVRECTVDIFQENLLMDIANQFDTLLPVGVELPEPPALGDLNIEDVMSSLYYWN